MRMTFSSRKERSLFFACDFRGSLLHCAFLRAITELIKPMWVNAWGKLPRASPCAVSYSSEKSPRWFE